MAASGEFQEQMIEPNDGQMPTGIDLAVFVV